MSSDNNKEEIIDTSAKKEEVVDTSAKQKIEITKETQDKIDLAKSLKKTGDEELKSQKYDEALKSYTKAVITVKHLVKEKLIDEDLAINLKKEILIPSNLNMSFIDIKKKDWDNAIRHCNKVLFVEKNHVKALYRRCTAYVYKGNFKKADEDLFELEDLIGGTKELEQLEQLFEENKRKADGNNGEFLKKMAQKIKGKELFVKDTSDLNKVALNKAIDSNANKEERSVISKWYNKTKEMVTYIICCKCRRRKTGIKEKTE